MLSSVRGSQTPVLGRSNPRTGENEPPYWAANPLHGSHNSAPRVSKFCSVGLKNPLRLGIRELSTAQASCSTPLRCLSLLPPLLVFPIRPHEPMCRVIPYSAGFGLRVKDCGTNPFFSAADCAAVCVALCVAVCAAGGLERRGVLPRLFSLAFLLADLIYFYCSVLAGRTPAIRKERQIKHEEERANDS